MVLIEEIFLGTLKKHFKMSYHITICDVVYNKCLTTNVFLNVLKHDCKGFIELSILKIENRIRFEFVSLYSIFNIFSIEVWSLFFTLIYNCVFMKI